MALALMQQQNNSSAGLLPGRQSPLCVGDQACHAIRSRRIKGPGIHFMSASGLLGRADEDDQQPSSGRSLCIGSDIYHDCSPLAAPDQNRPSKLPKGKQPLWSEGECIEVNNEFSAADGNQLTDQLQIGKNIGSGSTADVYQLLLGPDGNHSGATSGCASGMGKSAQSAPRKSGQVLKWAKPVPGLRQAFQREWMLGRRLNAAAQHDPSLSILLQTGPAVVSCSPSGHQRHQQKHHQHHQDQLVFRGAVLEGINGQSLDKRLEEDSSFCDIDFILACLQKVLTALDRAHALVGFEHGDLRISNIMEHVHDSLAYEQLLQNPDTWRQQGYDSAASAALAQGILSFKLLDWGHSTIHESRSRHVLLSAQQDGTADFINYANNSSSSNARYAFSGSSSSGFTSVGTSGGSLALKRLPPAKGLLEAFYSFWYKGKSDSWRLLRSLATRLDGRAWPERKRQKVLKFYELIDDLLGLKLQARFFQDVATGPDGQARRLGSSEVVYDEVQQGYVRLAEVPALDVTAKPRRFKLLRRLRDKVLRWWSRLFSRRPRVSAREVLHKMRCKELLVLSE